MDDLQGGIHTHVGGDQCFLKVVEHIIVNLGLTRDGTRDLTEDTLLSLFQSCIKRLFFLLIKKSEYSHRFIAYFYCKDSVLFANYKIWHIQNRGWRGL